MWSTGTLVLAYLLRMTGGVAGEPGLEWGEGNKPFASGKEASGRSLRKS